MAILAIGGVCHHRGIEVRIHLPGRTAQASIDHGHYGVRQRPDLIAVLRQETVESRNLIVPHLLTDANAASSYGSIGDRPSERPIDVDPAGADALTATDHGHP